MSQTIHVYKHAGHYVVRPAATVVPNAGQLRVYNLTDKRIVVTFPHAEFKFAATPIEARTAGAVALPKVSQRTLFPYSVYSEEARDFCVGDSSPVIIIED